MSAHRRNLIVSILFTLFGGPGIALIYVPFAITRFRIPAGQPLGHRFLAAALIIAGLTPALESVRRFIYVGRGTLIPTVPTEHLVVSGLYRYVRNPMYVGVMVALAGEATLFWSRGLLVEWALVCAGFNLVVRLYEEPTLTRRHPEEYPLFKRHVPRWFPRLTPWNGSEN